mgnify:FL=1
MNLKLIGSDCSNGLKILKNIKKVERELHCSLNINKISSHQNKNKNIIIPALMLNGEIISQGKVITDRELKNILKPLLLESN